MADNNLPQEVNRPLGPGSIELQVTLIHRPTSRHINIKLSTIKDNEGILKAERQQQIVTFKAIDPHQDTLTLNYQLLKIMRES